MDASVYDREINPTAQSWFKSTARHLLGDLQFYEDLLQRHQVQYQKLHSDDPGTVLYEDAVQIVVRPRLVKPAVQGYPAASPFAQEHQPLEAAAGGS